MVANEGKELAKQTAKATEDIGQKIKPIQADTKGTVQAIAQKSVRLSTRLTISPTALPRQWKSRLLPPTR